MNKKHHWLYMWSRIFSLGRREYAPYARSIAYIILPCHEDWWWQYRRDHNPANDNSEPVVHG